MKYDWGSINIRRLMGESWSQIAPDYNVSASTLRKAASRRKGEFEENGGLRILLIDIETAPNTAYVWGLWKQNVAPNQIVQTGRVMCFAAMWYTPGGSVPVGFFSEHNMPHETMIRTAWDLLDQADAIVHYNGSRFDVPTLNREFVKLGLTPPRPYHQIDLLKVVRQQFRFASNRLEHILAELRIGEKGQNEGFTLWVKCMDANHPEHNRAWEVMENYNRKDVTEMVSLYETLRPWIDNHPNHALYTDTDRPVCPNCGNTHMVKKGLAHTKTQTYQQYRCSGTNGCGRWVRERFTVVDKEKRRHIMAPVK